MYININKLNIIKVYCIYIYTLTNQISIFYIFHIFILIIKLNINLFLYFPFLYINKFINFIYFNMIFKSEKKLWKKSHMEKYKIISKSEDKLHLWEIWIPKVI